MAGRTWVNFARRIVGNPLPHQEARLYRLYVALAKGDDIEAVRIIGKEYTPKYPLNPNKTKMGSPTLLHHACATGCLNAARLLIGLGAVVDAKTYDGDTPLTSACSWDILEKKPKEIVEQLIDLLLENRADINSKSKDGITPLIMASKTGNSKIVEILCARRGIEVNAANNDNITPLLAAINGNQTKPRENRESYIKIINLLLDNGADIKIQSIKSGLTPLTTAILKGHIDIVELLIERGADINTMNNNEDTPLLLAIMRGYTETVKLLIDNGAEINPEVGEGRKPLHVAIGYNNDEIIRLLIEKGATIKGYTLKSAVGRLNVPIVEIILKSIHCDILNDDLINYIVDIYEEQKEGTDDKEKSRSIFCKLMQRIKTCRVVDPLTEKPFKLLKETNDYINRLDTKICNILITRNPLDGMVAESAVGESAVGKTPAYSAEVRNWAAGVRGVTGGRRRKTRRHPRIKRRRVTRHKRS